MESDKVTLSFTEANYRQAMSLLIANKIPFSGTVAAVQPTHNIPMPFASQISGEITKVIPLDYLPYDTIAVSKRLYDEMSASGDIVAPETSA